MTLPPARDASIRSRLELWGGVECTVNRVENVWHDQLVRSGHDLREEDLDRFAETGIEAIRYPVVWERIAPGGLENIDWSWPDRRLQRLRELGIRPIAALVHHGSGPAGTSLTSDNFAPLLAEYAARVAERYPWLQDYTPVNEPLTTARFSALYGHWYPHERSDRAFVRALLNQCRGTVLAMKAIRRINPQARLIQTEDLAFIHSTPKLAYQARFENHRCWLTLDLLTGRVQRGHPLWKFLLSAGATEEEFAWFGEHPCPPDIAGFNYYLTSERFLDERVEFYPPCTIGSNGRQLYADVEAVRARVEGITGIGALLEQAWERYHLPLAVTEVHLHCHRESQLRWLIDAWQTAHDLRARNIPVQAITSWSLLGSFDWNSLCVRNGNHYESGAFDVRSNEPRPTAVAHALRSLSKGKIPTHPTLGAERWWQHPSRLIFPIGALHAAHTGQPAAAAPAREPIMIIGRNGALAQAFAWACRERRLHHVVLSRAELDVTDPESIERMIERHRPWCIVNTAGFVDVDAAEREHVICHRVNTQGAANLAAACATHELQLMTYSTDLVFDGQQNIPYVEQDATGPLGVYGRSKVEAEQRVLSTAPRALVVRTSAFFGPWDAYNYLTSTLRQLAAGRTVAAAEDWIISPTYLPDLVHACIDLLIDEERGLWHLANRGTTSWADFARQGASLVGMDYQNIRSCRGEELKLSAPRPPFSALGSERGLLLPKLEDGLRRYRDAVMTTTHAKGA